MVLPFKSGRPDDPGLPKTRTREVMLRNLKMFPEEYSHRDLDTAYTPEKLQPLRDSIVQDGMRNPLHVYHGSGEEYIVLAGHRRVYVLRQLVADGVEGFTDDMLVAVIELIEPDAQTRYGWSVADNETRTNLSANERYSVVEKFLKVGMPDERGAIHLGVVLKTYQRDLKLVRNPWMLAWVKKGVIPATPAVELIDAANKLDRIMELKTQLDEMYDSISQELEADDSEVKPVEVENEMRKRLTPSLRKHWATQLGTDGDLGTEVRRLAKPKFNEKTGELTVPPLKENLREMSLKDYEAYCKAFFEALARGSSTIRRRAELEDGEKEKKPGEKDSSIDIAKLIELAGLSKLQSQKTPPESKVPEGEAEEGKPPAVDKAPEENPTATITNGDAAVAGEEKPQASVPEADAPASPTENNGS